MDQNAPEALGSDLKALLETIDKQDFKALSSGLGLGEPRPVGGAKTRFPAARSAAAQGSWQLQAQAGATQGPTSPQSPSQKASRQATSRLRPVAPDPSQGIATDFDRQPRRAGLGRLLLAWGLDLLFVALTLATALALAFAVHAWRGDAQSWLAGRQLQWLRGVSPFISLAAVYALFLVYALFFRLLVGRTCGETLLGLRPMPLVRRRSKR